MSGKSMIRAFAPARLPGEDARRTFVATVGEFSLFGVREISRPQCKSGCQKRSRAAVTTRGHAMTGFSLFGTVAILSTAIGTSSLAKIRIQEPVAYAASYQDGNLTASAPFIPALKRGQETTTRPWSAPVGHRQPRVADVPTSASRQRLDDEDANVDGKINGICRGC